MTYGFMGNAIGFKTEKMERIMNPKKQIILINELSKKMKSTQQKIDDVISAFPPKRDEGFTSAEIQLIASYLPEMDMECFNNALTGITAKMIDGEIVIYEHDVHTALRCGIESDDMSMSEFD